MVIHTVLFPQYDDLVGMLLAKPSEQTDAHSSTLSFSWLYNWIEFIVVSVHYELLCEEKRSNSKRLYHQAGFIQDAVVEFKAPEELIENAHATCHYKVCRINLRH